MKKVVLFLVIICCPTIITAQTPGRLVFVNATAHIGDGRVIEKSLLVISGRTIESISDMSGSIVPREADTIIDLSGKHIYPSLINTNNVLGLHDAEAVRATRDFAEVGNINPHVRALIAYNTDNVIIPTVKTNGVLYTQVTPRGGLISGSSSVMELEGWNWEDAVLLADDGIHLTFPRVVVNKFEDADASILKEARKKYDEEMIFLQQFFSDARVYCNNVAAQEKNIRFEAMRPVFKGSANLYVHADQAKDILAAIDFCKRYEIKRPVLVGGRECYRLISELRKNKIPVMLGRTFDLPFNSDDDVDQIYRTPALLQKDSVLFCIQIEGDMESMNSRNLPFNAGAAVAYGITKEQALSSITLNAARILGIDNQLGTLAKGKLASLVVSTGDILDMRTNNITLAFIAGEPVKLTNHQTELYQRYKNKYGFK